MEENNLFSKAQHGFVTGRSCSTQLLELMEELTEILDSNKAVDMIYLDFSKAFDKVPHKRLLKKLWGYGIRGKVHSWIKKFFVRKITKSSNKWEKLRFSESDKWNSARKCVRPYIISSIYQRPS